MGNRINFVSVTKALSVALISGLTAAGAATARDVRVVDGVPKNGGLTAGFEKFTAELSEITEGRYEGKFFGGSLFNYSEIPQALSTGLADVGFTIIGYSRAEYPINNLVSDIATATMDPVVAAGAMSDFILNCQPCVDEFKAQNQIVMGFSALGPYYMYSKPKVQSLSDMNGKRIRGFGSFGRWVDQLGGSAAVMSANEIYSAVGQGNLDGNTHTLNTLVTLSMGEVADYLLNVPIAVNFGNALFNVNGNLWTELSDEDRRNFLRAAAIGHATATVTYMNEEQAILNDPTAVGVELVEPSEDLKAKTAEFRADDVEAVKEIHKGFGVADVDKHVDNFLATVKKWEGLVAEIDATDPEAVAKLYTDEIFGKVDLATFN